MFCPNRHERLQKLGGPGLFCEWREDFFWRGGGGGGGVCTKEKNLRISDVQRLASLYRLDYESLLAGPRMRHKRNIEDGIRHENILAGSGCAHFNWWGIALKLLAGCGV